MVRYKEIANDARSMDRNGFLRLCKDPFLFG